MKIVYPPEGHNTFESQTFAIGSVESEGEVTVNGQSVYVSHPGFFSVPIALKPGSNKIQIQKEGTETIERSVVHQAPPDWDDPNSLNAEQLRPYLSPQEPVQFSGGEWFCFTCVAPPNSEVTCEIAGVLKPVHMLPVAPYDSREGVFAELHHTQRPWPKQGVYALNVQIPKDAKHVENKAVIYTIKHPKGKTSVEAPGQVTIGSVEYAYVKTDDALMRTSPKGARLTPLMKGAMLPVTGIYGDMACVKLTDNQSRWMQSKDLTLAQTLPFPQEATLHLMHVNCTDKGLELSFPLIYPVPMEVTLHEKEILLRLYRTVSRCDFIHYGPGVFENGLISIDWQQQTQDTLDIRIQLDKPLAGFERSYDEESGLFKCIFKTRRWNQTFKVVIDAGHGGEETGSTAPNGTFEKEVNLIMAEKLKNAIYQQVQNVEVIMIRDGDDDVSLQNRVDKALEVEGDLLISVHHNALPDGRDPQEHRGVSTYYYHPFALPCARLIQKAMVDGTDFSDYGILYDSLHMCRVWQMPSLLLELGFFTHPQDAAWALDNWHQDRMVGAIAYGVKLIAERG